MHKGGGIRCMVGILRNQSGNISTPLLIIVGGVSLLLAHSEMKNLNMRVDQVREASQRNLTADVSTPLKILGWKCSDTHAFLMEGIYVEAAVSQQNAGEKVAKTKA